MISINKRAVVLLSGGLDSTTCTALAHSLGYDLYALTIHYGQRHKYELEAAKRVAQFYEVKHHVIMDVNLALWGESALTCSEILVAHHSDVAEVGSENAIPDTYVPARNTVLLSLALAYAETIQAQDIFIGINSVDYSGYPDCRPEFLEAYENMANLATRVSVQDGKHFHINAPLLRMSKAEIIRTGINLGVNYAFTHSCYDPDENGTACGTCDACLLRLKGFRDAGEVDPIKYIR